MCCTYLHRQIAYSVIDTRPQKKMAEFCTAKNVKLLCYGTLMVCAEHDAYLPSSFDCFNIIMNSMRQFILSSIGRLSVQRMGEQTRAPYRFPFQRVAAEVSALDPILGRVGTFTGDVGRAGRDSRKAFGVHIQCGGMCNRHSYSLQILIS